MKNNRVFKIALLLSIIGHGLCLGLPVIGIELLKEAEEEKKELQIEIEKFHLIPEIDEIGAQAKYKKSEDSVPPDEEHPKKNDFKKEIVEAEEGKKEIEVEKDIGEKKISEEKKIDVEEADQEAMLRYHQIIKQRIQESMHYPRWAKKRDLEGHVDVSFVILSTGLIKRKNILKSSGIKIFDDEALSTIKRAAPFPAIPSKNLKETQMQVRIVFSLK